MFKIKWLVLIFLLPIYAFGSLNAVDKAYFVHKNIMDNGGFENGLSRWSASAGTLAVVTSGTNLLTGGVSSTWDAAALNDTLSYNAITIPNGLKGKNGLGYCSIQTPSGTATHKIQIYDGSNVLSEDDVVSSTSPVKSSASFIFPSSGTVTLRLEAQANEPLIAIDDCYLGAADNLFYGKPQDSFSATVDGTVSPSTVSKENYNWLDGNCTRSGTGLYNCPFVAGIFTTAPNCFSDASSTGTSQYCRTTTVSSTSVDILCAASTSAAAVNSVFELSCQKTGVDSVELIKPDTTAMSWSGRHGNDCVWQRSSATYGLASGDATCTFAERTNTNFGTVTSASDGNNQPGITFTPKKAGKYFACVKGQVVASNASASSGVLFTDGTNVIAEDSQAYTDAAQRTTFTLCGIVSVSSVAPVTLQVESKAAAGNIDLGPGTKGESNLDWSIFAIDQQLPAPVLVNSVVSSYAGVLATERVYITQPAGVPTVSEEFGDWINGAPTDNALGDFTLTFNAGIFSSKPHCQCTVEAGATNDGTTCFIDTTTTGTSTTMRFQTHDSASAGEDENVYIECTGPR